MTAEMALGITAGIGLPVALAMLASLVRLVWIISGMKSDFHAAASFLKSDSTTQWTKFREIDEEFKDVRCDLADHEGRLKVVESRK